MKTITLSLLLFSSLITTAVQAGTLEGSELILKKDLTVESRSEKHFGKKEIYDSSCALIINNRSDNNITIPKETVLTVDKVASGLRRLEPGFPEAEAVTHIFLSMKSEENNLVEISLSCESGIYNNKNDAFMAYVSPSKVLKKFKDFVSLAN